MAVFEVPLSPAAQTFSIALGGTTYQLTLVWRDAVEGGWFVDFADANGAAILSGVPLVTGVDLLDQYAHLGFVGSLIVQTDHDTDALPTFDNLGVRSHLYFVT
jgi:hypothetical protein